MVIVGNHRDAWVYGGVDPSSGTAALVELARTLGDLARTGWQPRRSILFASWDAEEFALTSSTEWSEQHHEWLRHHAVAYLNVDSAASGPNLSLKAVPALNRVLDEAARVVKDPGIAPYACRGRDRDRQTRDTGTAPSGTTDDFVVNNQSAADPTIRFSESSRHSGRGCLVRRPLRRVSLDLRQPCVGLADRRSRVSLPRALVQLLGARRTEARQCRHPSPRLRPYARRIETFRRGARTSWFSRPMPEPRLTRRASGRRCPTCVTAARRSPLFVMPRSNETRQPALVAPQPAAPGRRTCLLDPDGLPGGRGSATSSTRRHSLTRPSFSRCGRGHRR